jgi:hypothetical protein
MWLAQPCWWAQIAASFAKLVVGDQNRASGAKPGAGV